MSKASLELGGGNWGTKDGNLLGYAQGNESSNLVPREFTFTRGSDIAATRVNSSGLIEKYRENLLLQSNQFDTTWTLNSTSVTSGQSGYDGSSDAWLLNSTTTGFPRIEQLVSASGVSTFSVYAKPATDGFALIRTFGAEATAWFDLINGTITNASGAQYVSSKIQFVGNGWYRCSVTFNGSLTTARIYPASAYGTYSTSGNGVYIQDTQIEKGLVATSYLESGATTATSGVADNEPRIDYAGGTASLLLEPSRTNLVIHSEYINSPHYGKSAGITLTNNYGESPQGVLNSTRVQSTNDNQYLLESFTLPANKTYVFTCYVKGTSGEVVRQYVDGNGAGVVYEDILLDGTWQRNDLIINTDSDGGSVNLHILFGYGVTNPARDVETWGWQLEEGSYPTSYIPTYGTSVTRNEDSFQNSTNDKPLGAIGQGTWFVELQKLGDDTNQALYLAPTTNNTQQIRLHFDVSNARFRDARNGYATIGGAVNVKTSLNKMALSIDTTSGIAKVYGNGSQLGSDYTLQANTFEFSRIVAEGKGFILKQSLFFPNALSDAELAALTT